MGFQSAVMRKNMTLAVGNLDTLIAENRLIRDAARMTDAEAIDLTIRLWLGAMLCVIASQCGTAHAQEPASPLAVALGRVCANEDSRPLRPVRDGGTAGELTEDCQAIYQVARNLARIRGLSELTAVRALAPHVSGIKPTTNPRHRLYGSLPARGTERPPTWVDAKHGPWSVYAPHWAAFRSAVERMTQLDADGPCEGAPIAWGCEADAHIARARGLVRVACGDRNQFWARPPKTIDAADAARGGKR